MICPPCKIQQHEGCRWPGSCPCQHVPSENVVIAEVEKPQKVFRNISLGHPAYGDSGVVVPPVVDELKRPSTGVTHSLQDWEKVFSSVQAIKLR